MPRLPRNRHRRPPQPRNTWSRLVCASAAFDGFSLPLRVLPTFAMVIAAFGALPAMTQTFRR
jgi:hypothetical protein